MEPIRTILIPGSVLPAQAAYGGLIAALGPDVEAIAKDLELYTADEPPADWTLDTEIEGVLREAEARGWEWFHLAGYSGGGAAALAFAAKHPERLLSLALLRKCLLEAAWAGDRALPLPRPVAGSSGVQGARRKACCARLSRHLTPLAHFGHRLYPCSGRPSCDLIAVKASCGNHLATA